MLHTPKYFYIYTSFSSLQPRTFYYRCFCLDRCFLFSYENILLHFRPYPFSAKISVQLLYSKFLACGRCRCAGGEGVGVAGSRHDSAKEGREVKSRKNGFPVRVTRFGEFFACRATVLFGQCFRKSQK
jgi:hypothetical protein